MSESINPLKVQKYIDPRLLAGSQQQIYAISQGAATSIYRSYPATSISNSMVQFTSCNPPSNTFVSKTVYLRVKYILNFVGTCPSGTKLLDSYGYDMACRSLPVQSSIKTSSVNINGSIFTENTNDVLPVYQQYHYKKVKKLLSLSPYVVDNCQKYSELVGSNRNVLAGAQNVNSDSDIPRGGFCGVKILQNTSTTGQIEINVMEPLFMSPFVYDDLNGTDKAFYGIDNFNASFNFDNDIASRVFSISDNCTSTFTNISCTPIEGELYFNYLTQPNFIQKVPRQMISYPYNKVDSISQTGVTVQPYASNIITCNNLVFGSMPSKIYVSVRRTASSYNIYQTNSFARINNVDILLDNKDSVLSRASPQQLHSISVSNGLDTEFSSFYGQLPSESPRYVSGVGSVFCLSPLKDIGISNSLQSAGTSGNISFQLTVNFTNLSSEAIQYDVYIVPVYNGTMTLYDKTCIQQKSIVSTIDMLNNAEVVIPSPHEIEMMSGGSFFTNLWSNFKNVWNHPVSRAIRTVAPYIMPLVGLGDGQGQSQRMHPSKHQQMLLKNEGQAIVGGGLVNSDLVGGKKMTKKRLLELMK